MRSKLFEDHRKGYNVMKRNFTGPPIMKMKGEIRAAIRKMKTGKATKSDSILLELLEAPSDYGIDMIAILLNEIYDTCQIPLDISKSYKETKGNSA